MDEEGETKADRRMGWQGWTVAGVLIAVLAGGGTWGGVAAANAAAEHDRAVAAHQEAVRVGGAIRESVVSITEDTDSITEAIKAQVVAAKAAAEAKAAADAAAAQAAAMAAQQAAADEAARQAAAEQQQAAADDDSGGGEPSNGGGSSSGLPAGSPVPWILNPDPQDTAGGRWDTGACASGSASGNPAICD